MGWARRDGGEVTPLRMQSRSNERLTHMLEPAIESHTADTTGARGKRSPDQALQPVNLPDLLLVERARSKDARAFETLMRRYNRRLFRIARSIVPDEDEAERVVQEAYLFAFADLGRYEPPGKFAAWLARLAYNHALTLRGSRVSVKTHGLPQDSGAAPPASAGGGDSAAPPSRQLLEQAIDALPEVFRTVFVLRMIEGISGIETAACLGINETTVRTRLYRAQRRLGASMGGRVPIERGAIFELPDSRSERIVNAVFARLNGTLSP